MQVRGFVFDAEGKELGNIHGGALFFLVGKVDTCIMSKISDNIAAVQLQIAAARAAMPGTAGLVTLLAVSKMMPATAVRDAIAAGQRDFGENYIQEAVDKITQIRAWEATGAIASGSQWHCIGPIQSNKTRLVAEHFDWAQTIDRLKIAQRLHEQRPAHLPPLQVCIQVNIDGAASKSGVAPSAALELAQAILKLPRLQLRGIMTIPDPDIATKSVSLKDQHTLTSRLFYHLTGSGIALDTLSMGMSADMADAIAAGSTMVRVGTAIFGVRPNPASVPPKPAPD
jgi:PLP dependent protein